MAVSLENGSDGINLGVVTVTKNRTALTGMAWVRFRSIASATTTKVCGYSIGTNAANSRFTMQWASGTPGRLQAAGRAADADNLRGILSPTTLIAGPWFHLVGIVDYENTLGAIYINGALDTSGPLDGTFTTAVTANTNSLGAAIGSREGGNGTQGMNGDIEDFRLYDGVLGPNEIQTIYAAQGKDGYYAHLLHRYQLDDLGLGEALVGAACLADTERIVGVPIGTPTFTAGISTPRGRQKHPRARGR